MNYCRHNYLATACTRCAELAARYAAEDARVAIGLCRCCSFELEAGTEYCTGHNRMMRYDSAAAFAANN